MKKRSYTNYYTLLPNTFFYLILLFLVLVSWNPTYSQTGQTVGEEFQVNTVESVGYPEESKVTMNSKGDHVVVWSLEEFSFNEKVNLYGQLYNNKGDVVGSEFLIGSSIYLDFDVVMKEDGGFIVVFTGQVEVDCCFLSENVYVRIYDGDGFQVGSDIQANTSEGGEELRPKIAIDEAGSFVVVWENSVFENNGDD